MEDERHAWDRLENETPKEYAAFRLFRDAGPLRKVTDVTVLTVTERTIRQWSYDNNWNARAAAWDDCIHVEEDRQRLESLRDMHRLHREAGRAALELAVEAFAALDPEDITASAAARLLELGAKLERDTLTVSVEELQGSAASAANDPWEAIARDLAAQPE